MFLILTKRENLLSHFSKEALDKLSINNKYLSNKTRNIILFISLILMTIALARPVMNEKEHENKQELHSLVLALDISKSMMTKDIYPNRLEFAKKKLIDFTNESKETSLGLVLFAKNSFILSPLTIDFNSLKLVINNLDSNMGLSKGTSILTSIESANKLLKSSSSKNLLLLSDGADKNIFEEEIKLARKYNISVYIIAIGTKKGAPLKEKSGDYLSDKNGSIVTLKLNENIKELALQTNGGYIKSTLDKQDILAILKDIKSKSLKDEVKNIKHKSYTELFYYPLALALILIFIAFSSMPRRSSKSIIVILFLLIFLDNQVYAYTFDFEHIKDAKKSYEEKNYKEAQKSFEKINSSYEQKYNIANTLYKQNRYEEAIKHYKKLKTDDINKEAQRLHNLGNSYAKSNDFKNAIKSYEKALRNQNNKETKENLETIKKLLENQKKKENNPQSKEKEKKNNQKKEQENKKPDNKEQKNINKNKQKNKSEQAQKKSKIKKEEISKMEEKRWLDKLNHQKTKPFMKEIESSAKENINSPW
jgi:Ca-activated chloride channel family protein